MRLDTAQIRRTADMLRDMLGEDFDHETFMDTLEGETDVMEVMAHLIRDREQAKAYAAACKEQANTYEARRKRLEDRANAVTRPMGDILDAVGERKIAHPLGTVSRTKGRETVQITDENAVPSQLCKVVTSPDKTAIKAQLEAGEAVPGAALAKSPDGVSVRIK